MEILVNTLVLEVKRSHKRYSVTVKDTVSGAENILSAEAVLVAAGRKSNADRLNLEKTGVGLDKKGFIQVDEYLETTRKNIFAAGDIIGKYMFTHVVNREAVLAWHNAIHGESEAMDYSAIPHAIFTYPQIASVGKTEAEARQTHHILVGVARYSDVAQGIAMMEEGFAKAIVDADTERILGFHIIGPEASTLIQEVINAMANGGNLDFVNKGMHIHPALPELIVRAFNNLEEPEVVEIRPQRLKAALPRK
jgi:mycothione reductase